MTRTREELRAETLRIAKIEDIQEQYRETEVFHQGLTTEELRHVNGILSEYLARARLSRDPHE